MTHREALANKRAVFADYLKQRLFLKLREYYRVEGVCGGTVTSFLQANKT